MQKHGSAAGMAKLGVNDNASRIITHAYQPCLLQAGLEHEHEHAAQ